MTFERTSDMRLVFEILTEPRCWSRMTDDGAPSPERFAAEPLPGFTYVLAIDKGGALAVFVLIDGDGYREVHFCFRPEAWRRAPWIGRAFVRWAWEQGYSTLLGPVPGHNEQALRLALACGFRRIGSKPNAVAKDGKLYDLITLQAQRPC